MRLKRLQLFGFKSFADRTAFEFGEDTLTGVVGPNGCGKSNVVDAVRWVLGEQRPTSMRGGEMTDVIFKGSSSRPALSVAEVTLLLDNANGALDGRGPEVAITRRVFQSGEGEYLVDGQKVRLKDVREMLFDTGLGSRGYSVLEQGKIDAVLSANPVERRRIFEEAAGVSRYRQRRQETELRLKRVADDLARLDDLLGELASRVRSLKIQAGKAERWTEARAAWLAARTRHARHGLWLHGAAIARLSEESRALEARAAELRAAREQAESDRALRERERAALSAELDRAAGEASRLSGESRAVDERVANLRTRISESESSARDESERAARLAAGLEARRRESAELASRVAALEAAARAAQALAMEQSRELAQVSQRAVELRAALEQRGRSLLRLVEERTQAENRIASLEGALAQARERDARQAERCDAAQAALALQRGEEAQLADAARVAGEALLEIEAGRRSLAQAMSELGLELQKAEAEKKGLEIERARVASRIDVLLDRERDLEDLSAGGKTVLETVERRGEPVAADDILGLLADHLRTDTAHALALDAVLGARGSALVAKDRASAEAVLAWLRARESGSAGLVLPQALADAPAADAIDDPRVVGPLAQFVRSTPRCEPLARALLGDVFVARDLSAAIELVARHPRARFVTLSGELADAAGVTGGHRALTQGAVGRRASAEELSGSIAELDAEIAELEARRIESAQRRIALQKDWERSSQELEARRNARMQADSALSTARARLRDQEALVRALEQEARAAEAAAARLLVDLDATRTRFSGASAGHDQEREAHTALEAERASLDGRRAELAAAESEARSNAAHARAEHEGEARRSADLVRVLTENEREHERAARLASEHASAAERGAQELVALEARSAELLAERAAADARLAELRAALEAGVDGMALAQGRESAVSRELETVAAQLADARLAEQKERLAREEIARRALEDLQAEEPALLQGFDPEPELQDLAALQALESDVRELKARLDKIGPVNTEAVAELQEAGGRLDFLEAQRQDLVTSRDTLQEAIREIDGESKRLFHETFEAVRANFQRIFRQLFGGGKADVTLTEGDDPLDAGVEIVARPPGRELLPIGLLSGGQRTLTALALLFAVFEARPSPFCILDEVDAALDDVNVTRFLAMLEGYRQTTQFVVVTHNKVTMAACQRLYGVTMETKGVSRQVSVEVADVDHWAEKAADGARDEGLRQVELIPQAGGGRVGEVSPGASAHPAPSLNAPVS
ncbi:MAG: chromosome segregation protein SMC [Planctomycetes bacterium]|nr:chromosome segregation protein SMC [Planctomycetota bacterium]